ncbi:uncharacterized protein [Nicotiana sylvestris]|uniref:uncharacterized protein n=1 Tax=Nicotiana sylvestris TaxID=4096 RepID=UPI00388CC6E0
MANMVGQVLESHKITFHEDELSPEGLGHNKALHITAQYEDYFITRILINGGSNLNICPLVTLKKLGKGLHEIKDGAINIKAFDGSQRSTIGDISICLQKGPIWFDIDFQGDIIYGSDEEEALAAVKNLFLEDNDMDWNVLLQDDIVRPEECRATYMSSMTIIFHDMIHKEIEVYVDDVTIKSKKATDHMEDLGKFFNRLRSRFIAQPTVICEPIFKMLKKDVSTEWTEDCQKAFDRIKEYLSTPPVLVPPEPENPLLLYLIVLDGAFGYVLG